jgi:hypothetical protein
MRGLLKLALAAACLSGASFAPTGASAQYYYDQYGRLIYQQPQTNRHRVYNNHYIFEHQPNYVPPRVARKRAQQQERFVEKYGYQYQQPQYYGHPRPRSPYHQGHGGFYAW